ncbi:MFS general substrate transporter [Hysterangium stoloniferum]|nr:MFS general substrate transporter [Hysterangium stoloniferum]
MPASSCKLPWGNGTKSVSSVILIANGISFAVMTALFTCIGSVADYSSVGRWLLLILTVICWGAQFGNIALTSPHKWVAAMALYMISFTAYSATLVLYAALFPRIARNTPRARELKEKYQSGELTSKEYELETGLEKSHISNIHINVGYVVVLLLNLCVLMPLANNPKAKNYIFILMNVYWLMTGMWWFIFQQPRPGSDLPKGENYLTIGWKQIWVAVKSYRRLPYTFLYLISTFMLADGSNTTISLVSICQNNQFQLSFLQTTYLGLSQALTSTLSAYGSWYIQKHYKISAKKMFAVTNVVSMILASWGMVGIWTTKMGFHNVWEFWAYNVIFGLLQAPSFAFSQTMMGELTPPGFDNMFFGLFGLSNRASSMIGPNVVQAIIDRTHNNWHGFTFPFALCTIASLILWFGVDVQQGRRDAIKFSNEERKVSAAAARGDSEKNI